LSTQGKMHFPYFFCYNFSGVSSALQYMLIDV
jgi:hypothetical protein